MLRPTCATDAQDALLSFLRRILRSSKAVVFALLTLPGAASAQSPYSSWAIYIEPLYGTAIIDNIRSSGIGTGDLLLGVPDGSLREGRLDDGVAGLALRLERELGRWNTGLNLGWRYRTDWDLTARTFSIRAITNVFSNVQTSNATVFIGRHWHRGKHRFALDAGVGLVRNRIETEYLEREDPGVRRELRFEAQTTRTDFAWDTTLSWHRPLSANWLIGGRYRFAYLGTFKTGDFPDRPAQLSARHRSHDVLLSIGRRF